MKKLLQVNIFVNSGSTGRIAEEIGQLAIKQGWESYIAYGRNDTESKSKKIKIGNKLDVLWHVFLTRFFGLHGFGSKRATKQFIQKIEQIQPNIIHLHNIHGYYLNIKILFSYLAKKDIPIVWTLHDCWTITGHGGHFTYRAKKKGELYWTAPKSEYPNVWFYLDDYKKYKHKQKYFSSIKNLTLVPVSKWLEDIMKQSYFGEIAKFYKIYNGVDLDTFKYQKKNEIIQKYNLFNKKVYIAVASVWTKQKGLDDFISFSKNLKKDEVIVLVGVTDEIISKLPKDIIGIKRTENVEELVNLYLVSNIFLNLTYQDTFPTTNLESLACGTPIITYKTGGSPEAVSEETGIVIEQGNLEQLRQAIDTILIEQKNGKFTAEKCRARAEKYYNKDDRFQEYLSLYDRLLQEQKCKR